MGLILRLANARLAAVVAIALVAGCGGSGVSTVPVEGRITFNGQPPPTSGKITFAPLETFNNLPRRPGTAEFDADGAFTVTTFEEGDGLIPGRYQANILCWREQPTLETRLSANYVPHTFRFECTIEADADAPVQVPIDVPVDASTKPAS